MIELEKTYLAKNIPNGVFDCDKKEIIDCYFPKESEHPIIRLRKNKDKYQLTKKQPINDNDKSSQIEQNINLSKDEFDYLLNKVEGEKASKIRYYFDYKGYVAEFDIFQDGLKGLVLIDFEFETLQQKENFEKPYFCLADVTQEEFVAGGKICGKSYEDIKEELDKFNYKKL